MPTIQETYWNALLADATYAFETNAENVSGQALIDLLKSRMTETLATYIAANFSLVTHIENGDTFGSGFDATVWRRNDGKLYVSMQGTTGLGDFLTDADLSTSGGARAQWVDMVNWWMQITTPAGQQARQIRQPAENTGRYFEEAPSVSGAGLLLGATNATVNGHSLGGHLSTAFARIFSGRVAIDQVSTFNSAGFLPQSNLVFNDLRSLLGFGASDYLSGVQTNYFAQHGLNVTTNTFFNSQIGTRIELFNENSSTQIPNHYMYKLTDALALAAALERLDPSLTIDKANALFEAGSNEIAGSIEGVLDGLRRLVLDPRVGNLPTGDANDSAGNRVTFHETLRQLQASAEFQSLAGHVNVLNASTIELSTLAQTDFSAIASLITLSPVVLQGKDPEGRSALEAIWQGASWNATHQQWLSDYALRQQGLPPENFTTQWLADRSALLGFVAERNRRDYTQGEALRTGQGGSNAYWYDYTDAQGTAQRLNVVDQGALGATGDAQRRRISFGSDAANAVDGGALGDHLYGGAGADTVQGLGGNDHLEGNAGADSLEGGAGNDTLVGGTDEDTYRFNTTSGTDFGSDTVIDAGGQGQLMVDGYGQIKTDGVVRISDNAWRTSDDKVRFTRAGADLVITVNTGTGGAQGTITVRGWQDTQLGLSLGGSVVAQPNALQGDGDLNLLRGTFAADRILGLGENDGLAREQVIDMYNWWQELTTPLGASYQRASAVRADDSQRFLPNVVAEPGQLWRIDRTATVQNQAPRLSASAVVDVTGHSLGGQAGSAAGRISKASANDSIWRATACSA